MPIYDEKSSLVNEPKEQVCQNASETEANNTKEWNTSVHTLSTKPKDISSVQTSKSNDLKELKPNLSTKLSCTNYKVNDNDGSCSNSITNGFTSASLVDKPEDYSTPRKYYIYMYI